VEVIAGVVTAWSNSAQGTLTFPAAPVTPPGSNGNITIMVTSPQLGTLTPGATPIQVHQNPLLLDASASKGTGALTFSWSTFGMPVSFVGTGMPGQILVTFPSPGDYTIILNVTDQSTGQTQQYSVILEYNRA